MKNTKCLICESTSVKKLAGYYQRHGLLKCRNCGFVFMEQIPTFDELNTHYERYSYTSEGYLSPLTVLSYNLLLDEFERYRKSNKILDVGCGRGWFLQEAKKRKWDVHGTEYSKTAGQICERKGISVKLGKLDSHSFQESMFDIITSFEVIEHINNPTEELQYINRFLRKGGLFYCTTPNFNSLLRYYLKEDYNVIEYPEHLSYYTKKTLNQLLTNSGFTCKKCKSTGISITRIKTSMNASSEKNISSESSDEKLRKKIYKNRFLQTAKSLINALLTNFSIGMTLKGYYIKK